MHRGQHAVLWTRPIRLLLREASLLLMHRQAAGPPSRSYAMPDRRTVYMTDDGSNVGFFMFKADRPNDLSSGGHHSAPCLPAHACLHLCCWLERWPRCWPFAAFFEPAGKLYAAKFTQTSGIGGGAFKIDWILLGSGG
jgi:hypothetical protein